MNKDHDDYIERMGEIAGLMQAALESFQASLSDAMSQLHQNVLQQRTEAAQSLQSIRDMAQQASAVQISHGNLVKLIERQWPQHLDSGAERAGHAQAQAFGADIAAGIVGALRGASETATEAARRLEQAGHRLRWKSMAMSGGAMLAFAALVVVGLSVWADHVRVEVVALQLERAELTRTVATLKAAGGAIDLARCAPGDARLCVRIDRQARFGPYQDYAPVQYRP